LFPWHSAAAKRYSHMTTAVKPPPPVLAQARLSKHATPWMALCVRSKSWASPTADLDERGRQPVNTQHLAHVAPRQTWPHVFPRIQMSTHLNVCRHRRMHVDCLQSVRSRNPGTCRICSRGLASLRFTRKPHPLLTNFPGSPIHEPTTPTLSNLIFPLISLRLDNSNAIKAAATKRTHHCQGSLSQP
jgi:hypothetical protein